MLNIVPYNGGHLEFQIRPIKPELTKDNLKNIPAM
jgi:hypothetical protein